MQSIGSLANAVQVVMCRISSSHSTSQCACIGTIDRGMTCAACFPRKMGSGKRLEGKGFFVITLVTLTESLRSTVSNRQRIWEREVIGMVLLVLLKAGDRHLEGLMTEVLGGCFFAAVDGDE